MEQQNYAVINYLFQPIIMLEKNLRFSVVRYGNVFGSRGSVFPVF